MIATDPPSTFRVYSPSQTADWLQCPIFRRFRKPSVLSSLNEATPHVWQERAVEWEPARVLGTAVQAGYNVYLKDPHSADDAIAEDLVEATIAREFVEQPKYTLPGLTKLALRGVEALLEADLFTRHVILDLDQPLTHSRPDYVSRHETQGLGVTDLKVSARVDERYRVKRLSEYETDDQFWHYAWEVGNTLGEDVKWVRVILLILTPKAVVLPQTVTVTPERLQFWLEGAEQHWRDMTAEDDGKRPVVSRWPNCRGGKYGVCVAYDFCHNLDRDPVRATTYYDRVPK